MFDGDGHPVIQGDGIRTSPGTDPMVTAPSQYQVWSSVLGSSLTTVDSSGAKLETKLFAGGAHIATQQGSNTSIVFNTADPVTGTTAFFGGTGTYAVKDEETEPLGQSIALTDPGTTYPSSYDEVLGKADDPEWQCQLPKEFYGGFPGMPVQWPEGDLKWWSDAARAFWVEHERRKSK